MKVPVPPSLGEFQVYRLMRLATNDRMQVQVGCLELVSNLVHSCHWSSVGQSRRLQNRPTQFSFDLTVLIGPVNARSAAYQSGGVLLFGWHDPMHVAVRLYSTRENLWKYLGLWLHPCPKVLLYPDHLANLHSVHRHGLGMVYEPCDGLGWDITYTGNGRIYKLHKYARWIYILICTHLCTSCSGIKLSCMLRWNIFCSWLFIPPRSNFYSTKPIANRHVLILPNQCVSAIPYRLVMHYNDFIFETDASRWLHIWRL